MAYPSEVICLPYVCSDVDVSAHDYYGGSHPSVEVHSGQYINSSLVGTDYEAFLTASTTSCAVGAWGVCLCVRVCFVVVVEGGSLLVSLASVPAQS